MSLAVCTAGLCGNETTRGAFVHALYSFSLLGTGRLLEHHHVCCVQALLLLARDSGELLGRQSSVDIVANVSLDGGKIICGAFCLIQVPIESIY
jgi:hypothetical protein